METTYLVCAVIGSTLIFCQFVLTLFGLGADHDLAGHDGFHDVGHHDGAHPAGHGTESSWFFSVLSFRTLSAACAFFGLAGLAVAPSLEELPTLGIASLAGVSALFIVAKVMHMLSSLNIDGTVRIDKALGARGTVYLTIPGLRAGMGKVQVNIHNRTMEYNAVTPQDALPTGAPIVVVGVVNGDTVEVASANTAEKFSHA